MKQILNTLYIQTQGAYLRLDHETLKIEIEKELKFQIPLHHLGGIFAFGNVLFSPFLIHKCAEDGRNLVWLTEFGRFKARIAGSTTGNVLLRRTQNKAVDCPETTLSIARYSIASKLQNTRSVVMRASREAKTEKESDILQKTAQILAEGIHNAQTARDLDRLRGIEGYAAKAYFGSFTQMVQLMLCCPLLILYW